MKILIAGFGSIGRRHFRNLLSLGEDDIIFLRSKKSTLQDDEIAAYPVETDLESAFAHNPEAVIISNPTALHLDIAIPAAERGCHLLIEKPISHNMDRVDELEAAVARGGGKALTAFQFRFHPGLRKIAELLTEKKVGDPVAVRAHWGEYLPAWHPWEDYRQGYSARKDLGGGVVLTLCHPLDYLRWLFGEVEDLWAFTSNQSDLNLEVEVSAEVGLRFASGLIGSVHLNYVQHPPAHTVDVIGTDGTIKWDNESGAVWVYHRTDHDVETYPLPPHFDRNDLFLAEMDHFLKVIEGTERAVCDLLDGIRSLKLATDVLHSADRGEMVHF